MIEIPVEQVMRSPAATIRRNATASDAARGLYNRELGSLVVVDEHRAPIGVITKSDVNGVVARGRLPGDVTTEEIMSSPVVTVGATDTLRTAAELMRGNSIKKLPVLDDRDELVGVLTAGDLAYYLPTYGRRIHSRTPGRAGPRPY